MFPYWNYSTFLIDGHECKKIQIDFKNQQAHARLSELYMGTYELSDHQENGKPTWYSVTSSIYYTDWNRWLIRKNKYNDLKTNQDGDISTYKVLELPTQSKVNWVFYNEGSDKADKWQPIDQDISLKCTGNTWF